MTEIEPPPAKEPDRRAFWEGVYGFIEIHEGQVWVYGGTSHMGFNSGIIVRVDEGKARPVA